MIDVPDVVTDDFRENRFKREREPRESYVQKRNRAAEEYRHPA